MALMLAVLAFMQGMLKIGQDNQGASLSFETYQTIQ